MEPEQGLALLSQQDLLDFLGAGVRWEADPDLDKVIIEHDGEPKELIKKDVVVKLQADARLNLQDQPATYFDQSESWASIRSAIRNVLDQELKDTQPDEMRLQILEDEYARVLERRGIPKDRARELARQYARAGGEMAGQKPKTTTATARTTAPVPAATPAPAAPQRAQGLRPDTQGIIARAQERAATGAVRWTEYLRHPVWAFNQAVTYAGTYVGTLFRRGPGEAGKAAAAAVVKKAAGQAAAQAGKAAVKATVSTAAKGAAKGLATKGLLAALPTGVTQAVALALTIKDALGKFVPKELQEKLKDLWSKLKIGAAGLALWLIMNPGALIGGTIGGFIGSFAGPLGAATGFAAGAFLGFQLQGIASSILGTGGTISGITTSITGSSAGGVSAAAPATISVGAFTIPSSVASAASSFGVLLSGTGIPSITLISIGGGIGLVSLFTALTIITATATQEQQQVQASGGPKISISVKSEVDKKVLPNNSSDSVKYKATIISQSDKEIEISMVVKETLQNAKGNTILPSPQNIDPYPSKIAPGGSVSINYQGYEIKDTFNDSDLIFVVSVTAEAETETASSLIRIGNPAVNNDRPFGYPTSGRIARFEDDPDHRGTFFNADGSRYFRTGGIDIINAGGTPVYSTVNGTVIYSAFDYGNESYNCTDAIEPVPPFKKCAVGGVVIVKNGNYTVSFLHLREQGLAKGTVAKGQIIGYMYDNPLPTSDIHHVHYQVLLNGANVPFGTDTNDSKAPCTPQKIWPEIATEKTITQDGSGPFVCQ